MTVDLVFPAVGDAVPTDHAYPLYGALSQVVPAFHAAGPGPRFAPLSGASGGKGRLQLTDRSVLRVRLPAEQIPVVLPLAGAKLDVAGAGVRLGVPRVEGLVPSAAVFARAVVVKHRLDADALLSAVRTGLAALGVAGEATIPVRERAGHGPEPCRRVVRVKGGAMVGYAVVVSGLTAEGSVRLQEHGLGGRVRMGCGFFLPVREGK